MQFSCHSPLIPLCCLPGSAATAFLSLSLCANPADFQYLDKKKCMQKKNLTQLIQDKGEVAEKEFSQIPLRPVKFCRNSVMDHSFKSNVQDKGWVLIRTKGEDPVFKWRSSETPQDSWSWLQMQWSWFRPTSWFWMSLIGLLWELGSISASNMSSCTSGKTPSMQKSSYRG